MDVKHHVIVSVLLSIFLFPFYGWLSLLIIVGGVLIDVDHYFWFVVNKRNWSLKEAYKFMKYEDNGNANMTLVFHNIEFWALCAVAAYFIPTLFPFIIGLLSHITMDLILFFKMRRTHPNPIAYSLIWKYLIKR